MTPLTLGEVFVH